MTLFKNNFCLSSQVLIKAPPIVAVIVQTLLLLALNGECLPLDLPPQLLGQIWELPQKWLTLKLPHTKNMVTLHPVFRRTQQQLLTALTLLLHLHIQDMLAVLLQAQLTQVLLNQPLTKVTSTTFNYKPNLLELSGPVNVSSAMATLLKLSEETFVIVTLNYTFKMLNHCNLCS